MKEPSSNTEWKYWGVVDALYGVCSVLGKSRTNRSPWTEDDFYRAGAEEFATNLRHWNEYGRVATSCVEIGCGVGRMTSRLQQVFDEVHACDVSAGMLEIARQHCDPSIVAFYQTNGTTLPLADEAVTAVYSTIVFQHFAKPAICLGYFREIYRVLQPGSSFMINLPWHQYPNTRLQWPYHVAGALSRGYDQVSYGFKRFLMRRVPRVMSTRVGRQFGDFSAAISYDFPALITELSTIGFHDIEVRCYYVPIEERHHPFFFGRK
jgi:ubiquinone/menaquinone biosynthesis C-methylase UbiE